MGKGIEGVYFKRKSAELLTFIFYLIVTLNVKLDYCQGIGYCAEKISMADNFLLSFYLVWGKVDFNLNINLLGVIPIQPSYLFW